MGDNVVMPDHFLAIITIGKNEFNMKCGKNHKDAMHWLFSVNKNQFGPQFKNPESIIRGFKSAITMTARKINPRFAWKPVIMTISSTITDPGNEF